MLTITIVESNPRPMPPQATHFLREFAALAPDTAFRVIAPYDAPFVPAQLDGTDGVVFTGSSVDWGAGDVRAEPLAVAMRAAFAAGLPVFGSCNGMQLAAVVLGGACEASPRGREDGVAVAVTKTPQGRAHPLLAGRPDSFAVPCIHRDSVSRLPPGATLLAGNDHSPVQVFAQIGDGVDFMGCQYHPEFAPVWLADILRGRGADPALCDALHDASERPAAAARLGIDGADLAPAARVTELRNWLAHVATRARAAA
ncbi:MAG: type 1 glutamine amidotransferase [Limimaricola sp.]|uniref:type 1 glutamine amidotransferase n=1 Tax=Limimaricola sp. TaxID=2211665 RepID=UPI001DDA4F42|nr:type 1 glutamine amidotransferase [Limimaricola sp.]MBI1417438.1 type 1 glutamine amidotransferase [Limimaricola sp.]